jgi:hypothetical protein
MIYQQQLRYIQNRQLNTTSSRLFIINFIAHLQVWKHQGDRLHLFMDMNEHILTGCVACRLPAMGLHEATHSHWGDTELHTYVHGLEPIDAVWYTQDLEVVLTIQLSFREGIGNHCSVLVDIKEQSDIKKREFCVVHPNGRRLSSQNDMART